MNIAFSYSWNGNPPPDKASYGKAFVRINKGKGKLIQVSDLETPQIEGVDECIRFPREKGFAEWFFRSAMDFPYDHALRTEHDVVIRGDVSGVFLGDFDVAVAKEKKGMMNNGVVFVKNRNFYSACRHQYYTNTNKDNWNAIQVAVQLAIDEGAFRVRKLDPEIYNCIPDRPRGFNPNALIVHYKDDRKRWMESDQ